MGKRICLLSTNYGCHILCRNLQQHFPEIDQMLGVGKWRFQQDNDSKRSSRLAKAFLDENYPELWHTGGLDI